MTTLSKTVRVNDKAYTLDISIPPSKHARVLQIHGDVTDRENLEEAVQEVYCQLEREGQDHLAAMLMNEIKYTPENLLLIQKVGKNLLGTCDSADKVIAEVFGNPDLTLTDIAPELLVGLDQIAWKCSACDWWCEPHEIDDNDTCDDCRD